MSVLLNEALKWVGKLHDGPDVPRMAREIAQVFPDLSGYCANATPSTSWCGILQAWICSKFKIRPPHGDDGVGGFMYVDAWFKVNWGGTRVQKSQAQPGDLLCLSTPHHITMIIEILPGDRAKCVGGNQSDGCTIATYSISDDRVMGIIRPPEPIAIGVNPGTGTALRPLVKMGDGGATVSSLQMMLGVEVDGEFGDETDAAVRAFQAAHGLLVDGEVGDDTWAALMSTGAKPVPASDVPHAAEYADYWRRMAILPEHASELDTIARELIGNKPRYQAAVAGTKVPWFFVAVIHQRESSANFSRNIHNGQKLGQVTTIEPLNRGPFSSFEDSVNDWIALKGLNKIAAWPIERFAYQCELNNGMGYRNKGVPSAYLWSFSNIYRGGKYIADHVWSATAKDAQCGTMPMLKQMMALDASIVFATPQETKPVTDTTILVPAKPGDDLTSLLQTLKAARDARDRLEDLFGPDLVRIMLKRQGLAGEAQPQTQTQPQTEQTQPAAAAPPRSGLLQKLSDLFGGPATASFATGGVGLGILQFLQQFGAVMPAGGSTTGTVLTTAAAGLLGGGIFGKLSTGVKLLGVVAQGISALRGAAPPKT